MNIYNYGHQPILNICKKACKDWSITLCHYMSCLKWPIFKTVHFFAFYTEILYFPLKKDELLTAFKPNFTPYYDWSWTKWFLNETKIPILCYFYSLPVHIMWSKLTNVITKVIKKEKRFLNFNFMHQNSRYCHFSHFIWV